MSVIVTGTEMPKSCGECLLCIYTADEKRAIGYCHTSDEDYYCKALDRFMEYDIVDGGFDILGKADDCPLRSLDSVVEQIRGLYKDSQNGAAGEYVRGWDNAIDACLAVITRNAELSEEEERIEEAREENRRAMDEMGPANDYEIYGDPYFGHKGYYDE